MGILDFGTHNGEIRVDSHENSRFGLFEAKISTEQHSMPHREDVLHCVSCNSRFRDAP